MTYEIRAITADEYRAFMLAEGIGFGGRPTDADIEQRRATFEIGLTLAAFDDGQIVATAGAYSFDLTLPGGAAIAVPGVSWVSVLPTHRRRGYLTALMNRQLEDYAQAGYPLAMLTASESAIYGRFGYGVASSYATYEIDRSHGRLAQKWEFPGRVRLLEAEAGADALTSVYERLRLTQPGMLSRSRAYLNSLLSYSNPAQDGYGSRLFIAYESPSGETEGAAYYRIKSEWTNSIPNGTLLLRELYALSPEATAALWSYSLNVDLIATVRAASRPVDDPIRWMLADPRRLRTVTLNDDLWIRILDIPAALSARAYAAPDRLVLEVTDSFRPATCGRYLLDATADGTTCRRTDEAADLSCSIVDLGATYLGGVTWSTLAQAGRARELTPGVLRRADALFWTPRAPYTATPF